MRLRGFTLIELLVVVAMVAVLATMAVVGYRKYVHSANSAEAPAMIQAIRAAEESYKSEMMVYLPVSTDLATLYPMTSPDDKKYAWVNSTGSNYSNWQKLNVSTDGTVRFGYAVVAKAASTGISGSCSSAADAAFATAPTNPWYVVNAVGDQDNNGSNSCFVATSMTGEVYVENENE